MTQFQNASFKVQAGVVKTLEGLLPEKGAIIFDDETGTVKVGDGFNWRPLPATDYSALAVQLDTPSETPLLTDTPITPFTFFDTVAYQEGLDIVPTIGDTITIGANMVADFAANFQALCDKKSAVVLLEALVGSTVGASRQLIFGRQNVWLNWDWTSRSSLVAADVITLRITADQDCTFSLRNLTWGIVQVS